MEIRLFANTIIGAIILTACTKEDFTTQSISSFSSSVHYEAQAPAMPFASAWEEPAKWNVTDSSGFKIYTTQRLMPQLTDGIIKSGIVMVWTKNLADPTLGMMEKPMLTPFYFFPDNERPKYTEYWYNASDVGAISVSFRTNEAIGEGSLIPNNKVKLRYILIPHEVLQKNKHTTASVHKLTYSQLTTMLGIGQ